MIVGAHGVGGEVRLKVFADDLAVFRAFNGGALTLLGLRSGSIARFREVGDRDAAEALRGTYLTVTRDQLPALAEGEFYHADLIGLAVATPERQPVGIVVDVQNFGAGDVIEIEREDGRTVMVPLATHAVPHWDGDILIVDPDWLG